MIAGDDLTTVVHRDVIAIESLVPQWSRLWEQCPEATTFQRPEWIVSWMRAFAPRHPLLVEVRINEKTVGIAPLLIYEEGSRRILGLMGGGVSDYLDVLVAPDAGEQVLAAIMLCITQLRSAWDVLNFTDLPAWSALISLGDQSSSMPGSFQLNTHDICAQIPLPPGMRRIQQVIPKHKYSNLRNARSRFRNAGPSRVEVATAETLDEFLEALFALHHLRWKERDEPGVLADQSTQTFHRRVAPYLLNQGVLRFYGARLDGRLIATLYSFFERTSVLCYMQGFDPAYKMLGAGTLLFGAAIEDAIVQGKNQFDLLRGRESYKYSWGARETSTFCVRTYSESLSSHLAA